jgi:hypothetical protein
MFLLHEPGENGLADGFKPEHPLRGLRRVNVATGR